MKQKLLKGFWLRVGMIVAVMTTALAGTAWAETESVVFSEKGYDNGQAVEVYKGTAFTVTFNKGTNSNAPTYYTTGTAVRCYGSNFFTVSSDYTITTIELAFGSGDGTNAITTDKGTFETNTWTGSENEVTFTIGGTKGNRRIASITVTYEEGNSNAAATFVDIDASGITNTNVFDGTEAGALTATVNTADGAPIQEAAITWSGNNDEVATIDASTGAVTLVAAGSVTFTASYAGVEDVYKPSSKTYTMTVTNSDPNAPGTADNPYTVAQARAAIDAGAGVTGVYATGIVSKIVTAYSEKYGNISYNISEDGTEEADQLQAFRGMSYNGKSFTSADDIQVGDIVVIYGNLTKYNTTYEFAQGNQLVSLSRTDVVEPSIELRTTSVEVSAEGVDGVIGVSYRNFTDYTADVEFYEADGETTATYDWIIAEINEDGYIDYIVDPNPGAEARTAYMKVHALNEDGADVYSDLITVTQEPGIVADYAVVPFAYNGGKSDLPTGFTQNGLGNDYSASTTKFRFDSTGDYLIVKIDKEAAMVFFDIKGNGFADGTFTVQTSADGEEYADIASYTALGNLQTEALPLEADVRFIKWVYTEKGKGNVGLGNIKVVDWIDEVTVGEAGYATYVTKHNEIFPANVAAYTAAINGEYVALTQVTAVPKGTPVVLKGEGTFTLIPTVADNLSDVSGNELKASDGTVEGNGGIFVLAQPRGEKVGFYAVETGTKVAEGKAYLEAATASGVKAFYFEGDDATGINEELRMKNEESSIYKQGSTIVNLAGQRISKMQKGINIVGGKKVLR
ncbi:MAG: Ig-like domain-containing protein [Bacteroidaceae bacterium]|nr:Ig-like domain-containing protein [Bacteroidaceae bacterium]